jgi:hypothetical protein
MLVPGSLPCTVYRVPCTVHSYFRRTNLV